MYRCMVVLIFLVVALLFVGCESSGTPPPPTVKTTKFNQERPAQVVANTQEGKVLEQKQEASEAPRAEGGGIKVRFITPPIAVGLSGYEIQKQHVLAQGVVQRELKTMFNNSKIEIVQVSETYCNHTTPHMIGATVYYRVIK